MRHFFYKIFELVKVRLNRQQIKLVKVSRQRELTRAQKVENVSKHGSIAVDEEAAVFVDGCRQRAAEHRSEH